MLPQKTEQLWDFLKEQSLLAGFTLIRGSALALLIRHRISEDLDFVYCEETLPKGRLDRLIEEAEQRGFSFVQNDSQAAIDEFLQGGLDIRDYQQDFIVNNSVKVSFFTGETGLCKVLTPTANDRPRLATLPELFKTKSLVTARRSKTRDWLDLYLLFKEHDFSLSDYRAAFIQAGLQAELETALNRICSGAPQRDDEGYLHLLKNAPALGEMTAYFQAQRDTLEEKIAANAFRNKRNDRT